MNKYSLIKKIHKLLFLFEEEDYEGYKKHLKKMIILFNGLEKTDSITESIAWLIGLNETGVVVSHSDLKGIIMNIMNNVDRHYKEEIPCLNITKII